MDFGDAPDRYLHLWKRFIVMMGNATLNGSSAQAVKMLVEEFCEDASREMALGAGPRAWNARRAPVETDSYRGRGRGRRRIFLP